MKKENIPSSQLPPLIPLESFFKNPQQTSYQISPDGQSIAYLAPWENRLNIFVQKTNDYIEEGVPSPAVRLTASKERDIQSYFWKNDRQLIYVQDSKGDENYHLYLADHTSQQVRDLTPFPKVRVSIIDDLPDIENEILIGMNKRDPKVRDVYRLYLDSGKMELIAQNPGNITHWITDHDGKLRAALSTDGLNQTLLYRADEKNPFKNVITTDFRQTLSPLMFTYDNQFLYAFSNLPQLQYSKGKNPQKNPPQTTQPKERDKEALIIFDPAKGQEKEELFAHPEVDLNRLLYSQHRKILTGVAYTIAKTEFHFFDKSTEELQRALEQKLPGVEVRIADTSKDESRMIVVTFSDRSPGIYYLYDAPTERLVKLAESSPWLPVDQMAETKPIEYQARDGLRLHGYLTLPKGVEPKNLPLIVNPHGGPHARDFWTFNREAQFLANRGYAVLQVNFRGSTGFGRSFWEAGFKQWGRKMQDDLSDGVLWLKEQGTIDSKRVAIYGGSYGGYAALAGLTFTPELYACGVSYVGPSNLFTLLESIPPYWEPMRMQLYEKIGHPKKEKELLEKISPFFHADKIRAPLLVAQGSNDPRVKKQESDQIVTALRQRGIDVPYMVKTNEGHGFHNEENQIDFYHALEAFLAKYVKGRSSTDQKVLESLFK